MSHALIVLALVLLFQPDSVVTVARLHVDRFCWSIPIWDSRARAAKHHAL